MIHSPPNTYPLGTLIDLPAALHEPRPPLMKRMCARCSLVIGWVVCVPEQAGQITHTSCGACHAAELEAVAAYFASEYTTAAGHLHHGN